MIYTIGIHDGHNCGASLSLNGKIICSFLEERYTRNKNEVGFPTKSLCEIFKTFKLTDDKIHSYYFSSQFMHQTEYLTNLKDWYKKSYNDQKIDEKKPKHYEKKIFKLRQEERINQLILITNTARKKIFFLDHHSCHLYSAYYCSPFTKLNKKILGITADGSGDNISSTVNLIQKGNFKTLSKTSRHSSLGKIYSRITMLLGMKPWEHEYKVMGLAPYSSSKLVDTQIHKLNNLLKVDKKNLIFKKNTKLSMNYIMEYLTENFKYQRFDIIAGTVQKFTEEMILSLVKYSLDKTKTDTLVCGGGLFMNIKANKLIAELPKLKKVFFMPSAGDESLSIGAALYGYYKNYKKPIRSSINNLYLGKDYSQDENKEIILKQSKKYKTNVKIINNDGSYKRVAKLLSANKIIARCCGRSEWGARSLGNRSILCRPDKLENINLLNRAIKQRDFWMPFSPAILEKHYKNFIINNKNISPYFMSAAFDTIKKNRSKIIASIHPIDYTARPQVVNINNNYDFYLLLNEFYKLTNIPSLLNTSFNLHGEPIVEKPLDALRVFFLSEIDVLVLNKYIIIKS
ncbi:hypothetical protein OA855_03490 [Pelagibacteraceae bacterium]|nr:hypothetical protein [Pelagibacteraceae bacterium]